MAPQGLRGYHEKAAWAFAYTRGRLVPLRRPRDPICVINYRDSDRGGLIRR